MGHYDNLYEEDQRQADLNKNLELNQEIEKFKKMSLEEKDFIVKIGKNVRDYMGFFKVIKWNSK